MRASSLGVDRRYFRAVPWLVLLSACGPSAVVPPEAPPALNTARFSDATLEVDGRDAAAERIALTVGETVPLSGSFRLAESADQENEDLLKYITAELLAKHQDGEAIASTALLKAERDGPVVSLKGELKSAGFPGEFELRMSLNDPATIDVYPIYRTTVVVNAAPGTNTD